MQRIHDVLRICKQPVKERYDPAVVLRDHDKVGHDADKKDEYRNCKDQLFHHVLIQSGRLLQGVYFRRSLVHNWSGCVLRRLPDIYVLLALFFHCDIHRFCFGNCRDRRLSDALEQMFIEGTAMVIFGGFFRYRIRQR